MMGTSFARFHPLYQISFLFATQPANVRREKEELAAKHRQDV
jgi:hypothetical protein